MFVPPVSPPLSEDDITKHTLSGVSLRTHDFTLLASVATTAAGREKGMRNGRERDGSHCERMLVRHGCFG